MIIKGSLGYREVEKLGILLKELGDTGAIRGWEFEIDDLEITYSPVYDRFWFYDGRADYEIDLSQV